MQRTLFIGVGGSGGETVRYIMRELDRRLEASNWRAGLPKCWQFIHIDVKEEPDDVKANIPTHLIPRLEHLGLGQRPFNYKHYDTRLTANQAMLPSLVGWRPDPASPQRPPHTGAGQRRAVGRVVSATELSRIGELISAVTKRMSDGDANKELLTLAAHLGRTPSADDKNGSVFVINSLGGGAGSGTFLDVVQLLRGRSTGPQSAWLASPFSVVYAPDVFRTLAESKRRGVEANSLGALSELMNAFYHSGPIADLDEAILQAAGGGRQLASNVGPEAAIVIGGSNGTVSMATPNATYEVVGKAIATLSLSDAASDVDAYILGNIGEGSQPVILPVAPTDAPNPLTSMGFGSVSLGKDLFAAYATERLASEALNRMTRGYMERVQPGTYVRPETVIAERAEEYRETFFAASGLWEVGKDHDEVLDKLRTKEIKGAKLDKVVSMVSDKEIDTTERSASEWLSTISQRFDSAARAFSDEETLERTDRAREWVVEIQEQLLAATIDAISIHGLDIAGKLIDLLAQQVEDAEASLLSELTAMLKNEAGLLTNISRHFDGLKEKAKKKLRGDASSPVFAETLADRRRALFNRTEADLRALARDLLAEVRLRLIPPLRAAVTRMGRALQADLAAPAIVAQVDQWSTYIVGSHLQPTPNEVLLEGGTDGFPVVFEERLCELFESDSRAALSEAVQEVIRGGWPTLADADGGRQTLMSGTRWYPKSSVARPEGEGAIAASFSGRISATVIYGRSQTWVRERSGALRDHLNETLDSWLNGPEAEQRQRGSAFTVALADALSRSAPLVHIDSTARQLVHGDVEPPPTVIMPKVPLDKSHPAYVEVERVLRSAFPGEVNMAQYFGELRSDSFEVVSFLSGPVHPIAVASLTGDIHGEWVKRRTAPEARAGFYRFKRTRPLPSSIALSPELINTMTNGWITARILGRVWADGPVRKIWTSNGVESFPQYLLTDPRAEEFVFGSLMESYVLAQMSFANGVTTELNAYNELVALGSETVDARTILPASDALRLWVVEGKYAGEQAPNEAIAGPASGSSSERAEVIKSYLAPMITGASAMIDEKVTVDGTLRLGVLWELRELYLTAATDITVAAARHAGSGGPGVKESGW